MADNDIINKIDELLDSEEVKGLNDSERKQVEDFLKGTYIDGTPLQKGLGFSDKMMDFFYGEIYRLYNGGHYQKAAAYFKFLNELNPEDHRYIMGYAACKMQLNENLEAISAYQYLFILDPKNPFYPFYLGSLYRKLGRLYASSIYYSLSINLCGDNPDLAKLKEGAKLNIEALKGEGALL